MGLLGRFCLVYGCCMRGDGRGLSSRRVSLVDGGGGGGWRGDGLAVGY